MRLVVPKNKEHMITKKKKRKKKKRPRDRHTSHKLLPPLYNSHTISTLPRFASGSNPSPTFPRPLAAMANPHNLPPGNEAFGRLSALNSPLPSRSGTASTDHPIEFMMRQLAQARSALRLSNQNFPDLSPDAQAGTLPIESITIVPLSQLVQGRVTVSHELSGVTQAVATIFKENENLREELTDISSQLANLRHTQEQQTAPRIADLQASIRDLSHRVYSPDPCPPSTCPPLHIKHPSPIQPPPLPLQGRAKKGPVHHPHLPQPRLTTLNTSYHSTTRDLARRSATPKDTPGSTHTHTKPGNSGEGHTTWPASPQATSTLTSTPPPLTHRLPPAQARAAKAKAKVGSLFPSNLLRVRRPLLLKRGLFPFLVPNDASLLLASPFHLTQTLLQLPLPFPTSRLVSSVSQTASSPWVSLLLLTLVALSP